MRQSHARQHRLLLDQVSVMGEELFYALGIAGVVFGLSAMIVYFGQ